MNISMGVSRFKQTEIEIIDKSILFAKKKMRKLPPSHGWDHVQRVLALSERIARIENANIFIVKVSAVLHDIAREIEDKSDGKICHADLGSKIAYDFLIEERLNEYQTNIISQCIKTHRYRNNHAPSTIEAKILYDADKLDSIGAIGIGRAFLFSGEIGAKLHNTGADIGSTKPYTEEDTAFREYIVKLGHLNQRMLTTEGKRLAQGRHDFMSVFFKRLQSEIDGIE